MVSPGAQGGVLLPLRPPSIWQPHGRSGPGYSCADGVHAAVRQGTTQRQDINTQVFVLHIDPDFDRENTTVRAPQGFAGMVERPMPVKVVVLGMFGASWILTLGVAYCMVTPLQKGKPTRTWEEIFLSPLCVVVAAVVMREFGTRDGRPPYGVLLGMCHTHAADDI